MPRFLFVVFLTGNGKEEFELFATVILSAVYIAKLSVEGSKRIKKDNRAMAAGNVSGNGGICTQQIVPCRDKKPLVHCPTRNRYRVR